jgi:hypothetical protein
MIITYIPSRELFNLRTIRNGELNTLIDKELRDRGQSTIKIKLKFVYEGSSFIPPTARKIDHFIEKHSIPFLKEYLLDSPLYGMPDLSKIYYDLKYSIYYRVLSFKIPNDVVINSTDYPDKTFTIKEVIHSISSSTDSFDLHEGDELVMLDLQGNENGYISFSDVTLN